MEDKFKENYIHAMEFEHVNTGQGAITQLNCSVKKNQDAAQTINKKGTGQKVEDG